MFSPLGVGRLAALALLSLSVAACDSGDPDGPSLDDVLASVRVGTAQAQLVADPFPTDGTAAAPSVDGSSQVVRGGSALLQLGAAGADRLLVGVEGEDGYYRAPLGASGTGTVVVTMNADDAAPRYTLLFATESGGAVSAVTRRTLTVNTDAGASGQLQVSLNWSAPADLDLHLETPEGEDIYYGASTSESGGDLDLDSNAACDLDRVDNENIAWPEGSTPASGAYVIRVDYWSACGVTEPVPFVVTLNVRGRVQTFEGTFRPDDADRGSAFEGREVHRFTFPGAS